MTWVLGWPFNEDDAFRVAQKYNIKYNNIDDMCFKAIQYLDRRVDVSEILACYVGNSISAVFGIYVEKTTRQTPPTYVPRSQLPSYDVCLRIMSYLETSEPPRWYWYLDGSPQPPPYNEYIVDPASTPDSHSDNDKESDYQSDEEGLDNDVDHEDIDADEENNDCDLQDADIDGDLNTKGADDNLQHEDEVEKDGDKDMLPEDSARMLSVKFSTQCTLQN